MEQERENAVNEAKNAATKAAEASIAEARKEKEEAESIAYETIEAAEEAKEEAEAALARLKEEQDAKAVEFEQKIAAAQAAAEEARSEAAEEKRRRSDLEAGNEMEKMIEFEKRVAKATADLEKTLEQEREQREQAETDLANARHRVESLTAELDTVQTELTLSQKEEFRAASGDERVRAEFAKLQLLLDKKNEQIALLQTKLGIAPPAMPGAMPPSPQQQPGTTPQAPGVAAAPAPVTAAQVKTAEEQELEKLLSEVLSMQTPVSEAVAAAHAQLGTNSGQQLQNMSNPADTINPDTGMTALQEVRRRLPQGARDAETPAKAGGGAVGGFANGRRRVARGRGVPLAGHEPEARGQRHHLQPPQQEARVRRRRTVHHAHGIQRLAGSAAAGWHAAPRARSSGAC